MVELSLVCSYMGGATSGASKAAADMIIAARKLNHEVTVITRTPRRIGWPDRMTRSLEAEALQSSAKMHWITAAGPFPSSWRRRSPRQLAGWLSTVVRNPLWGQRLRRRPAPDLTIVHSFNQSLLEQAGRVDPRLMRRTTMGIHGSPREETVVNAGLTVSRAVEIMSRYDALLFVSSVGQREWQAFPALSGKPSFYIPNCCPDEEAAVGLGSRSRLELRESLGLPREAFVAVCVGSLQHRKGQDLLLAHMRELLRSEPSLSLYLVGPAGTHWARDLVTQIRSSPWRDRLVALGARSNAKDYIRAADLLILPSRAEAMPLTILEAMVLRTPVLASDVDGIPELIEHDRSGLLFHEPHDLVEAFDRMVRDPSLREACADRAHERYWKTFSRERHVQNVDAALRGIL